MKVFAVISEFNPFHNGHRYLFEQLRLFGATHIVAIMSGSFVQRGEPAILSKYIRAKCALLGGADLVLELPVVWASASAQRFAVGGVSLADALGCVDTLAFGSECGDIKKLCAAEREIHGGAFSKEIKENLAQGKSYARAVSEASRHTNPELESILRHPNNTLGIEYIHALHTLSSHVVPFTVRRTGAEHDSGQASGNIASASHIRRLILDKDGSAFAYMPENCMAPLREEIANDRISDLKYLERAVLYRLRSMEREDFLKLPDVTEGLENRIYSAVRRNTTLSNIIMDVKTKRYTYARIRRIIMSAFLGITSGLHNAPVPYLRVLGLSSAGAQVLKQAKEKAKLPVIMKTTDSLSKLNGGQKNILALDLRATDLQALSFRNIVACGEDYYTSPVRITQVP